MLYKDTHGKHLSLFLGLVDTRRNILHYINAGHVPPALIRGESGEIKHLEEGGTVIGLFPQADFTRGSAKLEPGDLLVCCTDGILEVYDENQQPYGSKRLADLVREQRQRSAQGIVDAVLSDVASYSTASMNDDDKVLIVLKVTSEKSQEVSTNGNVEGSN
jgi:sigma-B regulation protein RsbU (phosphoserine phosphatase)